MSQSLKVTTNLLVSANSKGETIVNTSPLTVKNYDGKGSILPRFDILSNDKLYPEGMKYPNKRHLLEEIPKYPQQFSCGSLYFYDMHKILKEGVVRFKEHVARIREMSLTEFISKSRNLRFHIYNLQKDFRKDGLGEIRINGYFGVDTGIPSIHLTSHKDMVRYSKKPVVLKEYGVSIFSYQKKHENGNPMGVEFLCKNVIIESNVTYKEYEPSFEEVSTAVFGQFKKTGEAILLVLETMLTAYASVEDATEEMFIYKDGIVL